MSKWVSVAQYAADSIEQQLAALYIQTIGTFADTA